MSVKLRIVLIEPSPEKRGEDMNKVCNNCGQEMRESATVCNLCGAPLSELYIDYTLTIDRHLYLNAMAENLSLLRCKLKLTQAELANIIGVSRQTIATAETGAREMSWSTFISLLFVFKHNEPTNILLPVLGIFTPELNNLFSVTNNGATAQTPEFMDTNHELP
jgi:DNA-binding XRE family transcriptional regulator